MFFHTFHPSAILFQIGGVSLYWYGLMVALGLIAAVLVATLCARRLSRIEQVGYDSQISSLIVPLMIAGIIGARILFVAYHADYFIVHPLETLFIWNGGIVWHGGLLGIAIALFFISRRRGYRFWRLADILAPGLALGQALGRWGNYFNQEAYGLPTNAPWGIPIDTAHRMAGYESFEYFHPTFLYESLGDMLIFFFLMFLLARRGMKIPPGGIAVIYLGIYSVFRFGVEMLRVDPVPIAWGLRAPQWISAGIIICCLLWGLRYFRLLQRRG